MRNKNSEKKHETKSASKKEYRLRRGVDKPFLTAIILLICAGIIMVATASYVYAGSKFGDNLHFIKRHMLFVFVGVIVMWVVSRIPYESIRRFTPLIFMISLALMVVVLLMGSDANGAKRWIYLGPLSIQPSEIMKFAVIVLCADYIDRFHRQITLKGQPGSFKNIVFPFMVSAVSGAGLLGLSFGGKLILKKVAGTLDPVLENGEPNKYYGLISFCENFKVIFALAGIALLVYAVRIAYKRQMVTEAADFTFGILPFGVLICVIAVLLALQPHMSGMIIITMIIVILMVIGGSSGKYLLGGVGVGAVGMFGILNLFSHSKGRLDVWKNPFDYLREGGWQPAQSLYAIGNGGIWGVGIGQSMQKHLYLPEPMNDYIFAILCEEFGFIGAVCIILLFVFFVYRGIIIAFRAPDRFSSLVVLGITAQVGLQALLNMMVVTNTIPSTGISLPFFSYGGSALTILLAEMGVILSISRYSVIEKK
jgi:cell division protein FtsW (lipid II flippase)